MFYKRSIAILPCSRVAVGMKKETMKRGKYNGKQYTQHLTIDLFFFFFRLPIFP